MVPIGGDDVRPLPVSTARGRSGFGTTDVRFRRQGDSTAAAPNSSNESFSGWTKTFTDPRLCAAIVDRLTFGGNIIETGTDSYRLATTRARAGRQATAS